MRCLYNLLIKYSSHLTCCVLSFACMLHAAAQSPLVLPSEDTARRFTAKELSIPESPVFDLMGVTPAQVTRMNDIKDFKVDWSFKSWKLNPNIAIEGQPVWEVLYSGKNLQKYQRTSGFMRTLSSLDVSGGTIQTETSDRRIGFAAKLSLYRQKDPLLMKDYYTDIMQSASDERNTLLAQLNEYKQKADTTKDIISKHALLNALRDIESRIQQINASEKEDIQQRAKIINSENWNASSINIAIGKVFTYTADSSGNLKKLLLNRNTALGFWVNWGWGIGKRLLLSGLIRSSFYEESLHFSLQDDQTGELTSSDAVAQNTLLTTGINMRYGGGLFSLFAEFIYERKGLRTANAALAKVFKAPQGQQLIASTVHWDIVHPYNINFGGDWRIARNVMLSYGLRTVFDKNFKAISVLPVATVACMMR